MVENQNETPNPFEGFVSEEYKDGERVVASNDASANKPAADNDSDAKASGADESAADSGDDKAPESGDDKAQQGDDDKSQQDDDDKSDRQESKVPRSVQTRINEAVKRQRAAERREAAERQRAAELEQRLAELSRHDTAKDGTKKDLTARRDATSVSDEGRPKPDDFEYGELDPQYISALVTYEADKRLAEREREAEETRQRAAAEQEAQERAEKIDATFEAGIEKYDDFEQVVIGGAKDGTWPLSAELGELIVNSDVGADIAYHLAKDPKEARRVFALHPLAQASYFGRMEAKFSSAKSDAQSEKQEPKPPKAPAPVTQPRGAGGKFSVSPDTSDFAAFEAMVNGKT